MLITVLQKIYKYNISLTDTKLTIIFIIQKLQKINPEHNYESNITEKLIVIKKYPEITILKRPPKANVV